MAELMYYLIRECFAPLFCIVVVNIFLIANKYYDKRLAKWFVSLLALMAIESFCGGYEKYLCEQPNYLPVRVFLSWVCYITGPAIALIIIEIILRNYKPFYRFVFVVPELINILVTSLAFFTKLVFFYDSDNIFHIGPLAIVPRATMIVYLILLLLAGCQIFKKSKWESIIIIVCVAFLILNVLNEIFVLTPLNMRPEIMSMSVLAYFLYFSTVNHKEEVRELNTNFSESERVLSRQMIDQAIETLAFTIDAKDQYTRGHSFRVAKYARQIARMDGKCENECREIYLAGLLHDIGKISIRDSIINKAGNLSRDEYRQIKKHSSNGAKILDKMKNFPILQAGAHYHHERYDGSGYPVGLKGEEIPEAARIIAVADAYDAMTSHRTYRKTMDQADVKQEIWKGMGTQFDPHYARIMISLIDSDIDFDMREKPEENDDILQVDYDREIIWGFDSGKRQKSDAPLPDYVDTSTFGSFVNTVGNWAKPSQAFHITDKEISVEFTSKSVSEKVYIWHVPSTILFSSSDGKFLGNDYEELNVMISSGYNWRMGSTINSKTAFDKSNKFDNWDNWIAKNCDGLSFRVNMRRQNNQVYLEMSTDYTSFKSTVNLPDDYDKEVYLIVTGEYCEVSDLKLL